MVTRLAMVVLTLLVAGPACAETLTPDAARRFVAGKLFAYEIGAIESLRERIYRPRHDATHDAQHIGTGFRPCEASMRSS